MKMVFFHTGKSWKIYTHVQFPCLLSNDYWKIIIYKHLTWSDGKSTWLITVPVRSWMLMLLHVTLGVHLIFLVLNLG